MKSKLPRLGLASMFVVAVLVMGCNKSEPPKEAHPPVAGHTPPRTPPLPAHNEHGQAEELITPGATSHDTWSQIAQEQTKLEAVIQSGDLAKVHHLAFGICDLAVAVAEKTTGPKATEIKMVVADIRASANKLDEFGDGGNLSGVKEEYAKLQQELQSLRGLTGGH